MVAADLGERTQPSRAGDDASSSRTFSRPTLHGRSPFLSLRKSIAARAPQSAREGACAPQKAGRAVPDFKITLH